MGMSEARDMLEGTACADLAYFMLIVLPFYKCDFLCCSECDIACSTLFFFTLLLSAKLKLNLIAEM
jgi:hypothetical protein